MNKHSFPISSFKKLAAWGVYLLGLSTLSPLCARGAEITPFDTFDQSPLVQVYGLPSPGHARILPPGRSRASFTFDLASNFAHDDNAREAIMLDGESIRSTLSVFRGFGGGYEGGLELPVVSQSGGFTDSFIEGWHRFFSLPSEGRPSVPRNRLRYVYQKDGVTRFLYTKSEVGVGDLRLTGGKQLISGESGALSLRASLKVPSGDSSGLMGSGSTDLSLWLTGQRDFHSAAVFGAIGALGKTKGDILPDQQRYLVGFGSIGAGWSPFERVAFKLQLSSHTPFYKESDLPELNRLSTLLLMGGTVALSKSSSLDIGVSEDVAVDRSPDVAFHLALSTTF